MLISINSGSWFTDGGLLWRHDQRQPHCAMLDLVWFKEMKLPLKLCTVYLYYFILSSSQNFHHTWFEVLTSSELSFFWPLLAFLVCLSLTVSLQEAQTRAIVLPPGNVSGKPEGSCFYGSMRWGFVGETSHLFLYQFSSMLSQKQWYRCPLQLFCVAILSLLCILCLRKSQ